MASVSFVISRFQPPRCFSIGFGFGFSRCLRQLAMQWDRPVRVGDTLWNGGPPITPPQPSTLQCLAEFRTSLPGAKAFSLQHSLGALLRNPRSPRRARASSRTRGVPHAPQGPRSSGGGGSGGGGDVAFSSGAVRPVGAAATSVGPMVPRPPPHGDATAAAHLASPFHHRLPSTQAARTLAPAETAPSASSPSPAAAATVAAAEASAATAAQPSFGDAAPTTTRTVQQQQQQQQTQQHALNHPPPPRTRARSNSSNTTATLSRPRPHRSLAFVSFGASSSRPPPLPPRGTVNYSAHNAATNADSTSASNTARSSTASNLSASSATSPTAGRELLEKYLSRVPRKRRVRPRPSAANAARSVSSLNACVKSFTMAGSDPDFLEKPSPPSETPEDENIAEERRQKQKCHSTNKVARIHGMLSEQNL